MPAFQLVSPFRPTGDQPQAIERLVEGLEKGYRYQTLRGITGSGKTFTMANIIQAVQRPTLVIAHNKTLAAQLATELKEFFPHNAVEYFVSYYDYYQPEAYVPETDTYIEKETDINDEIERLRHSATRAVLTRRDVIVVASVSCIYGLGEPSEYASFVATVRKGEVRSLPRLLRTLADMQYERNEVEFARGRFRTRGDTLEVWPAYEERAVRIEFWGDEVDRITVVDPLTGEVLEERAEIEIYPARHWVTSRERLEQAMEGIQAELEERLGDLRRAGKVLEAQRLEQRTRYDLEMLREVGYCHGIENYACHLQARHRARNGKWAVFCGSPPWTLLDYFPEDFLVFIDESHMTLPQLRGMYHGDISRKQTLVDYGFRLPSAMDNRPLNFQEFEERVGQVIFVSATPGPYELERSQQVVEQVIRPTGLLDPAVELCAIPRPMPVERWEEEVLARQRHGEPARRYFVVAPPGPLGEAVASALRHHGLSLRPAPEGNGLALRPALKEAPALLARPQRDPGDLALVLALEEGPLPGMDPVPAGLWFLCRERRPGPVPPVGPAEILLETAQALWPPSGPQEVPSLTLSATASPVDALLPAIRERVARGERVLVTTLTKRMAEELADHLREVGIKVHHLHADIDTLERSEILRDLRLGVYDVVVGINLLREGLDLPEVSLVAILDADKEGYLRSETSLVQTMGRAARHERGQVVMFFDTLTDSMVRAVRETLRRRHIQAEYNRRHGIVPRSVRKAVRDITERVRAVAEPRAEYVVTPRQLSRQEVLRLIQELEKEMRRAARDLEFEKAALLRDQIFDLRRVLEEDPRTRN